MESSAPPPIGMTFDLATIGGWALGIFTVAVLVYIAYRFVVGMRSMEEVDERETEFERELLSQLPAAAPAPPLSAPEPPRPAPPAPVAGPGADQGPAGEGTGVEDLARRLFALRVITDRQGTVPLSVPPCGLIYGLVRGGSCVLLPRQESDAVMEHMARRFDLVFYLSAKGEVLVLERFQTRLPALTSDLRE